MPEMNGETLLAIAQLEERMYAAWQRSFGETPLANRTVFGRFAIRMFICHVRARTVFKMEAARLLPLAHSVSAKKYLDEAERAGLLEYVPDDKDRRSVQVRPTRAFLAGIETYLTEVNEMLRAIDLLITGNPSE